MKHSGLLWWVGALILASLAGLLAYGVLATAAPAAADRLDETTQPVVVAATTIPFRRSIGESELIIRNLPLDAVPEGAATSLDQVVGKMSTVEIFANQPILTQYLVTPDIVTQAVALSVPEGKTVIAVPTQSKLISNRLIRPGDRIDLMATFDVEVQRSQGSGPLPETIALMQNLEVHAIILPATTVEEGPTSLTSQEGGVFRTPDEKGQSIILAVDPQDALTIRHILDVGGSLDLAVRAPTDESVVDIKPVDQFYLAERYGIDLNRY